MSRYISKTLAAFAAAAMLVGFSVTQSIAARITANVDISQQTMVVKSGNRVLYRWKVSTGKSGYRTPSALRIA